MPNIYNKSPGPGSFDLERSDQKTPAAPQPEDRPGQAVPERGRGRSGPKDRWRWVGAPPEDRSADGAFRRQIAAIAREVLAARGVDEEELPPVDGSGLAGEPSDTARAGFAGESGDTGSAGFAGESGLAAAPPFRRAGRGATAGGSTAGGAPVRFDARTSAVFAIGLAARGLNRHVGCLGSIAADRVLLAIAGSAGVSTTTLLRILDLPASTQSTVLRRLEARGLVRGRGSLADARVRVLEATPEGGREAALVAGAWKRAEFRLLDQLTPAEVHELGRLLRRATAALIGDPGER